MNSQASACEVGRRKALAAGPELPAEVVRFLRRLKHDLNNPIGTLGLEIFSLEGAVGQMRAALERGDRPELSTQLDLLEAICENLGEVFQNAMEQMNALDGVTSPGT